MICNTHPSKKLAPTVQSPTLLRSQVWPFNSAGRGRGPKSPQRVREGLSDCDSGGALAVSGNPSRISSATDQVFAAMILFEDILGEQVDDLCQVLPIHVGTGINPWQ